MAADESHKGKRRKDGMPVGRPFQKGKSGCPGGLATLKKKVRVLLRGHEQAWVDALLADMTGKPGAERTAAQKLYAAYRWGRPTEQVQVEHAGGVAVEIDIRGSK